MSNLVDKNTGYGREDYAPHKFLRFSDYGDKVGNGTKFPTWSCANQVQTKSLDKCYVYGPMSKYS